jgi:hypothetical protein
MELAVAGNGHYHHAAMGTDLIQTFRGIATGSPLLAELVESFGEQISRIVTEKLVCSAQPSHVVSVAVGPR